MKNHYWMIYFPVCFRVYRANVITRETLHKVKFDNKFDSISV